MDQHGMGIPSVVVSTVDVNSSLFCTKFDVISALW